ncbi:MAG TPA: ATP-grasp domain-containing protein [Acidobacteriaceae bacterium]|nr:ATP-grasp domain-containing protein [Acidobacteriaceae bacterium]
MAFAAAGCRVEIVCPSKHPVRLIRGIAARYSLSPFAPVRSLHRAIRKAAPDLLIPTDVSTAGYVRHLYNKAPLIDRASAPFVRTLLERSLGAPENLAILSSRTGFLAMAQSEGILTPPTQTLASKSALDQWLQTNPLPAVMKADETASGEGVEIVRTHKEAAKAWRRLHAPFSLGGFFMSSGMEHSPQSFLPWLRRAPRTVSIQPFISGRDATITVACWKGKIVGAISLDVLRVSRPKGPAVLVELTHNDAMLNAARTIVRKFRLSGLCGFDFITEHETERTYLIEANPRATQTSHLPYGVPRDLVSSLVAALSSRPLPAVNEAPRRGIIALFPAAWQAGLSRQTLDSSLQDIPWDEPQLVKAGFTQPRESFYE